MGAHVRKADSSYGVVQAVEVVEGSQPMYNLTVDQTHTFFVGQQQWLVLNACPEWDTVWASGTKGGTSRIKEVPGTSTDAKAAFDSIIIPGSERSIGNGGFIGDVPGGGTLTYRPSSKSGPPTSCISGSAIG